MIDCHCHFEQKDYDKDRDEVIEKCRKQLQAVVTSCAHPKDFELTMKLAEKYKGFVFATVGIHPEYIKEISEQKKNDFIELIKANKDKIVGIGEVGLDYIIEEEEFRKKQADLFNEFIELSRQLKLPIIIHARKAFAETIDILENNEAKNVLMHFFSAKELLDSIIKNDWYISVNTTLLTSKKIKKIVRDMPMNRILTETDAPWLAPEGFGSKRNDSTAVRLVVERIAKIKKINFEEVDRITTENAKRFFNLDI